MKNSDGPINNNLKKHRKRIGYSQKQVAYLLGFNATDMVSRWECGETVPGLINLMKLSLIYHVFPTDLYYDLMKRLKKDLEARLQLHAFEEFRSATDSDFE